MPSTPAIAKNTNAVTMKRRPMTVWLTDGEALQPRPGGPDRGKLPVQPQRAGLRAALGRPARSLFRLRTARLAASAAGKSSGRMHDDVRTASRRGSSRRIRRRALRSGPARRPGCAGTFTCPGIASILPARRGIQKEWMTSRLRDHDVDRSAGGQMQTPSRSAARRGRDSGRSRPTAGLRPRSAAAACRRQRQQSLAGDQSIGDQRQQDDGRQDRARRARSSAAATRRSPSPAAGSPARTGSSPARTARRQPASITHHSVAIEAAAGPEGSSVDSGPLQPASAAIDPSWTAARRLLRFRRDAMRPTRRTKTMANRGRSRSPRRRALSCWSCVRLDIGSAVALVGPSAPRDDGAFPDRVRDRDPRRRRLLLVVGRCVLGARRLVVGRHGLLDRRSPRASSARPSCCWCAASGCWRRAGRTPWRR